MLLRIFASASLGSCLTHSPRPVRFRVPRPFRSACLLMWPFLDPLLSWCWRLFRGPFFRLALSRFVMSESNIWIESVTSDSLRFFPESADSDSSTSRPLKTVGSVLFDSAAFVALLGSLSLWFSWIWPPFASGYPTISRSSSICPYVFSFFR